MEHRIKYREALGLTQDVAAQLLKIPKSLLGMFEIGQRPISSSIELQLVRLYILVQKQGPYVPNSDKEAADIHKHVLELKKELRETAYKQQVLERKLALFQSKHQKSEKLLTFVHILETEVKIEERPSQDYIYVLKRKAERAFSKYGTLAQTKLELKIRGFSGYHKALQVELKSFQ
ncbi:hypothetical protein [Flavobacterium sp. SM2513]|uniref:hypothetical protein n=1 Tax=Flavobacterium sp. SM2513 TaxID=3424766 RepID=UPI003D7F30D7